MDLSSLISNFFLQFFNHGCYLCHLLQNLCSFLTAMGNWYVTPPNGVYFIGIRLDGLHLIGGTIVTIENTLQTHVTIYFQHIAAFTEQLNLWITHLEEHFPHSARC